MVTLTDLVGYTDELLAVPGLTDYCPNGLQVEGRPQVGRLVSGVTASLAFLERALECEPDALLVHHGYFWKGEDPCLVGVKRERLARLLGSGLSLIAYHLPLDAHPEWGNNAGLARAMGWAVEDVFGGEPALVWCGRAEAPLAPQALAGQLATTLGREPVWIAGGEHDVTRIGWCTGAAQDFIEAAAAHGLDAFVSGEISERTVHLAREAGIHYFAAGHHATERFGVQALAAHLGERFGLTWEYVELDNPV